MRAPYVLPIIINCRKRGSIGVCCISGMFAGVGEEEVPGLGAGRALAFG